MLQSASRGGGWSGGGSAHGGWLVQGDLLPGGGVVSGLGGFPACTEVDTPPPPVDRHTLVKTLPWPNFVAAGKNKLRAFVQDPNQGTLNGHLSAADPEGGVCKGPCPHPSQVIF